MRIPKDFRAPGIDQANVNGWKTAIKINVATRLGLIADASGHYGGLPFTQSVLFPPLPPNNLEPYTQILSDRMDFRQYSFLFGPEAQLVRRWKFKVNAHGLMGAAHGNLLAIEGGVHFGAILYVPSETNFAAAVGGSLDIPIGKRFSYRVIQPEIVFTRFGGGYTHTATGTLNMPIQPGFRQEVQLSTGIVLHFGNP